ncbi:aminotransferase yhxA [Bacillus sp. 165]|uniref:aminotransferase yhxA n=1 Tax=Bacillus sp. 165 TaxID=1529117 RepID=UPI001ADA22C3|nr:aminotransferase yhxA [Bacillus sp. 165]MBO9129859.1 aminotransferase yhxA [Bacillus sp. 165]
MRKTKKVLAGVVTAFAAGMAGCNSQQSLPPVPDDLQCNDYEFDSDEGVWECDDRNSPHFGYYYFAGRMFSSVAGLRADSKYKTYKNSPEFKSGFGKGSKVSGS